MPPLPIVDIPQPSQREAHDHAHVAGEASFAVRRSWLPPFSRAPQQQDHHGHDDAEKAATVPLDLDEFAYGMKQVAKAAGPLVQRAILGAGVYWAFDGVHHSAENLVEWPAKWRGINAAQKALDVPELTFRDGASVQQQTEAKANQTALKRIASAHRFNHLAGGVLAAASMVGCFFMGSGLLCDDQMVGRILPSVIEHADACMSVAVPMMATYALGVAATAGRELVSLMGRAKRLDADVGQPGMDADTVQVAKAMLAQRQKCNGLAIFAGIAMGVGIAITCWVHVWIGLAIMMPGALSLPAIISRRHTPSVTFEALAQRLSSGSLPQIASELKDANEQVRLIDDTIARNALPGLERWGLKTAQFHNPANLVARYLEERAKSAQQHDSSTTVQAHGCVAALLEALHKDGLFETFALRIAQDAQARAWLLDDAALGATVNVTAEGLKDQYDTDKGPDKDLDAETTRSRRLEMMANLYLDVMSTSGRSAACKRRENTFDLWLARVDTRQA